MPNYTKLFQSIVTSTIWTEDDQTRIVWITMLAISDQNGEVQASIPGLARISGVSVVAAEAAIEKFLSPDKYSRTPDDEGRRIERIDGGWALLNHAKYRALASKEDSKEANAKRQHRHRAKAARNASVTHSNASVTHSNASVTQERDIAEAEAEAEADISFSAKAKKEKRAALILPFDHPDFHFFWENWIQHRKEKKSPMTPTAMKQQLDRLKEMGLERAIAALKHSMSNGWTGLFEPKTETTAAKRPQTYLERHPEQAHLAPTEPNPL